jgi:hypothetical protein
MAARRISYWFCLKGNVKLGRTTRRRSITGRNIWTSTNINPTVTLDKVMKLKTHTGTLLIVKEKEQLIN